MSYEQIVEKHAPVVKPYIPFLLLSKAAGEVFAEFKRNEDKFFKRMQRDDSYGFDDGTTELYNAGICVPDFTGELFEEEKDSRIVWAAFARLTPTQKKYVRQHLFGGKTFTRMEVKKIGVNADGMDVFIDKNAAEADGIIVNCRIKPHTSFRGPFESGIMKMMTIGLGKQVGAETCHRAGFKYMAKYVPMFGQAIIENAPILFAVATIENAYDQTAELVTVDAPDVYEQEPILLQRAFANMPRILVDSCELLIVDECGKYFSGNGMDPNVSGKFPTPYASGGIESQHIVALDIDEASHGNAQGLGLASATTVRAVKKLDLDAMYVNGITCKMLYGCEIPPFMNNDREAIQMGLAMCVDYDEAHPRIVRIPNTLHLEHIMLSEAYYDEARRNPNLIIESEPAPLAFDADGNLAFDLDNAP